MANHRTHRTHCIAFKRLVVQEYLAGETLRGLARRQHLSRPLIRIWVDEYEAGAFDEEDAATDGVAESSATVAGGREDGGKLGLSR